MCALLIRSGTLALAPLVALLPVVVAMIVGAVVAAYAGTAFVHRTSEHLSERIILVFLLVISTALIVEAFLPEQVSGLLPEALAVRMIAAILFGLGIGLVSSLLGVADDELIIPTLLFAFGAGTKTAGTASLLINLPTVAVGIARHARLKVFDERLDLTQMVAPIGIDRICGRSRGWRPLSRVCTSSGAEDHTRGDSHCLGSSHLPPLTMASYSWNA